jgi:hypothetical protein
MDLRYQNGGESQRLFDVFIVFYSAALPMAWQEQFSCQPKKSFFCKKRLDIAYVHMVQSPPGARGDFILATLETQEKKACQPKIFFHYKKAIDKGKKLI